MGHPLNETKQLLKEAEENLNEVHKLLDDIQQLSIQMHNILHPQTLLVMRFDTPN